MKRSGKRLAIRRETLRRLANGELGRVAGGRITLCTYERSGCAGTCNTLTCGTWVETGEASKEC